MRGYRGARLLLLAIGFAACSPASLPLAPDHPARSSAPTGRLAGPPAALRPGVAEGAFVRPPATAPKIAPGEHGAHKHDALAPAPETTP